MIVNQNYKSVDYGKQLFNGPFVYQPFGYFELQQHNVKAADINIFISTMKQMTVAETIKELQYMESSVGL